MPNQPRFSCPTCPKSFKLKPEMVGKKVSCPKCSTVFRVPAPSVDVTKSASVSIEPLAPLGGSSDPFAQSMPSSPQSTPALVRTTRPKASASNTSYKDLATKKKRRKKKGEGELSETDQQVQAAGIALVCLTIATAVLPLLGLQVRQLADLGEFAPIGGMILGLIGVGCICYARRNRSDVLMIAGAALVVVLTCGIGGFLVQSHMNNQEVAELEGNDRQAIRQRKKEQNRSLSESNFESEMDDSIQSNVSNSSDETVPSDSRRATGNIASSGAESSNPFAEDSNDTQEAELEEAEMKNDERGKASDSLAFKNQDSFVSSISTFDKGEYGTRWERSRRTFKDAVRSQGELGSGLAFEGVVGVPDKSGKLFYSVGPVIGLETMLTTSPCFIACYSGDQLSENAIHAELDGGELIGFNLAQDDSKIVGIQGIYASVTDRKRDFGDLSTSHWLGRETETTVEIKTTKTIYGIAIHGFSDCTGMSLITK